MQITHIPNSPHSQLAPFSKPFAAVLRAGHFSLNLWLILYLTFGNSFVTLAQALEANPQSETLTTPVSSPAKVTTPGVTTDPISPGKPVPAEEDPDKATDTSVNGPSAKLGGAQAAAAAASSTTAQGMSSSGFGGSLNFSGDPYTGRLNYTIPLLPAAARQGATPSLSLNYSSGGGNSWCGVGWNLEIGYIERETKDGVPIQWNNNTPATALNQYDDAKGFTFVMGGASAKLVPTTPAGYYQAEIEGAFLSFQFDAVNNRWLVIDKGGNRFRFGGTAGTVLQNPKSTWAATPAAAKTFRWSLQSIVDINGNTSTVAYQIVDGFPYPFTISYNGHESNPALYPENRVLTFVLEPAVREDTFFSYRAGFKVTMSRRLSYLTVHAAGVFNRSYYFQYETSPSTRRSRLKTATLYGHDNVTTQPPITFTYSDQTQSFAAPIPWTFFNITGSEVEGSVSSLSDNTFVDLFDADGDGLPDRVTARPDNWSSSTTPCSPGFRKLSNYFWEFYKNSGTGFQPSSQTLNYYVDVSGVPPDLALHKNLANQIVDLCWSGCDLWGALSGAGAGGGDHSTHVVMIDINGDGRVDRVMRKYATPYDKWQVQLNIGSGLAAKTDWTIGNQSNPTSPKWSAIFNDWTDGGSWVRDEVQLMDINGDGLPDRVSVPAAGAYTTYVVELNTGSGFAPARTWTGVASLNNTSWELALGVSDQDGSSNYTFCQVIDINGDGLPDRVMQRGTGPDYTSYNVQYNNGAGYEPMQLWTGVTAQGLNLDQKWMASSYSVNGTYGTAQLVGLLDINHDGLPDRVMAKTAAPYDRLVVQINRGSSFAPEIPFTGLQSINANDISLNGIGLQGPSKNTRLRMIDINGDGILDRVSANISTPWNSYSVQLGQGEQPDILKRVENGIGGWMDATYMSSAAFDHKQNGVSMLPYTMPVIRTTTLNDGLGHAYTTTYGYQGGYHDPIKREFRGYHCVTVTDPTGITKRIFYHQGGGYDGSFQGETTDHYCKKGIPYRTETVGSDGSIYDVTLSKVDYTVMPSGLSWFPYVTQSIHRSYPNGKTAAPTVVGDTASATAYNTSNGNVTTSISYGQVTGVNEVTQQFSDYDLTDTVYTISTFTPIYKGVYDLAPLTLTIKNKPTSIILSTSQSPLDRVRETQFTYDGNGNKKVTLEYLNLPFPGTFIQTSSLLYNAVGNIYSTTDAAGVTATIGYDSQETFPTTKTVNGWTTTTYYDAQNSGWAETILDANGAAVQTTHDKLFREEYSYIRPYNNATAGVWRTTKQYFMGGPSTTFVRMYTYEVNHPSGYVSSGTYLDGLGRPIQSRVESERGGMICRVGNHVYDSAGREHSTLQPYFESGLNYATPPTSHVGSRIEFDAIGRGWRTTPTIAVTLTAGNVAFGIALSDTGSPTAPSTVTFAPGGDPWSTQSNDALGKSKQSKVDGFGKIRSVKELLNGTWNTTSYNYDVLGNVTSIVDAQGHSVLFSFDCLGRKLSMYDANMGTWTYAFDAANRLTQQIDAKNQKITLEYNDPIGRLSKKNIFNANGTPYTSYLYYYDVTSVAGLPASTFVPKGFIYAVVDSQGYETIDYDSNNRVIAITRFITPANTQYIVKSTYDIQNRVVDVTYPLNKAKIRHSYNATGLLNKIESVGGLINNETFVTIPNTGGDQFGALSTYSIHGTSMTRNIVAQPYTRRAKEINWSNPLGGYHQQLTFAFDEVSNIKDVVDVVNPSASKLAMAYDDLHRVKNVTYGTGGPTSSFTYDSIGNMLFNSDNYAGSYFYDTVRYHAVLGANVSYAYDANGCMTSSGAKVLTYNPESRLIGYQSGTTNITFGYSHSGDRLWRQSGANLSIWIGNLFEVRPNGDAFCHVSMNGHTLASFQSEVQVAGGPMTTGTLRALAKLDRAALGLLQIGVMSNLWYVLTALAIICVGGFGLHMSKAAYNERAYRRRGGWWRVATTGVTLFSLVGSAVPANAGLLPMSATFYYHIADHLGSTTKLLSRDGTVTYQQFQYRAFGKQTLAVSDHMVTDRYTGQDYDDETGLCFYQSRYYDPALGRFIQPDTVIGDPTNPQTLNRYAYCGNNPINQTDPDGHDFGLSALIIGIVIGAAIGGATAAATGGNIGLGILTGAIGGLFGGLGAWAGGAIGAASSAAGAATIGAGVGGIVGGAAGGAVSAAVTGGDIGMGALTGAISGIIAFEVAQFQLPMGAGGNWYFDLANNAMAVGGGALGGGIGSAIQGGDFWAGAAGGAIGAAISYTILVDIPDWVATRASGSGRLHLFGPRQQNLWVGGGSGNFPSV